MNALVITNLFPSAAEPTRGLFNLRGFAALADRCNVRVLSPRSGWRRLMSGSLAPLSRGQYGRVAADYPIYWTIPRVARSSDASAMYYWLKRPVLRLHREVPIDAIVGAFAYPDGVAAARIAQDIGCPFVAFVLGSDINVCAQEPALRPQITQSLESASRVIAVTVALKSRVVEMGIPPERVIVQYNGVEGDRFAIGDRTTARNRLGISVNRPLVCFVGNLVPEKGPDVLVEALAGVPDVDAVFIGDGTLRESLQTRCEELGTTKRVRFLGRLPPEGVALWLSASSALCLPSRREGCPNVVLEALACGRPVVASAVGGVPELLHSGNGILVEPDNPQELAAAIHNVLTRNWDAHALRATVPSLSWDDLGRTLHEALVHASETYQQIP